MHAQNKGFTLIELMVVIAILGILVSVALPSYRSYVLEGQRSDMQGKLLSIIELQERYYIDNLSYADDMNKLGFPVPPGSGSIFKYAGEGAYNVVVKECIGPNYPDNPDFKLCYILDAEAIGNQIDDGGLLIDNRGRKEHNDFVLRDWRGNDL